METYNGWTNYETWAVKLWMDNDQGSQEYWAERAKEMDVYDLEQALKDEHEEFMPENIRPSVYGDLLQAALDSVNWREVAESIKDEADEENEEEDEES
jgi:hypothetical protein